MLRLVASRNQHTALSRLARYHIHTRCLLESEWHTTDCCLCFFLDLCLGLGSTVPVAEEEATILNLLLELLVVVALIDMSITECACLLEDILLNSVKKVDNILCNTLELNSLLFKSSDWDGVECRA